MTLPFILGGKSLLLDIFRADDCMNLFEAEKATCVLGATPFVFDILEELRQHPRDLSSLRFFLCGGTTIPPKLFEDCRPFGIRLLSIYGSTESSPHSLVRLNDTREHTEETDGCAVDGVEIRVVDDARHEVPHGQEGEEASRGPQVFVGYWGEPEMTARALDAVGWYYSGDYCRTDSEGRYIRITGRKKDIIITAGGKNVSPIPMEQEIAKCPIVEHAVVVGDNRPFIGALVTLDPEGLAAWLPSVGLSADTPLDRVAATAAVHDEIQKYVDKANATVSRAESVRKFIILPEEFTQENGLMTASMKVIRPKVIKRYATLLNTQMYTKKK